MTLRVGIVVVYIGFALHGTVLADGPTTRPSEVVVFEKALPNEGQLQMVYGPAINISDVSAFVALTDYPGEKSIFWRYLVFREPGKSPITLWSNPWHGQPKPNLPGKDTLDILAEPGLIVLAETTSSSVTLWRIDLVLSTSEACLLRGADWSDEAIDRPVSSREVSLRLARDPHGNITATVNDITPNTAPHNRQLVYVQQGGGWEFAASNARSIAVKRK